MIDVAAGAVDAASAFFSSLQPVNTNADAIAVIANKFFNFMFFPFCIPYRKCCRDVSPLVFVRFRNLMQARYGGPVDCLSYDAPAWLRAECRDLTGYDIVGRKGTFLLFARLRLLCDPAVRTAHAAIRRVICHRFPADRTRY
mgnify:CR=1 FL=1